MSAEWIQYNGLLYWYNPGKSGIASRLEKWPSQSRPYELPVSVLIPWDVLVGLTMVVTVWVELPRSFRKDSVSHCKCRYAQWVVRQSSSLYGRRWSFPTSAFCTINATEAAPWEVCFDKCCQISMWDKQTCSHGVCWVCQRVSPVMVDAASGRNGYATIRWASQVFTWHIWIYWVCQSYKRVKVP